MITERDFREPQFRDADPADYERRRDGAIVRKDRWERGIRDIASLLDLDARTGYEIADVVEAVKRLLPAAADETPR